MFVERYRPTLLGTLKHMAVVSWAIWRDYREAARLQRARARHARRYALATEPSWRTDGLHIAVVAIAALATLALALYVADAWPLVFDFVRWSA